MNRIIKEYVNEVLAAGFRVFISASGEYGFFTDSLGTRVISFGTRYLVITLSGNYKTDIPHKTGVGWGIGNYHTPIGAFNQNPPNWAIENANWSYTTLKQHLEKHQQSSQYKEILYEPKTPTLL